MPRRVEVGDEGELDVLISRLGLKASRARVKALVQKHGGGGKDGAPFEAFVGIVTDLEEDGLMGGAIGELGERPRAE